MWSVCVCMFSRFSHVWLWDGIAHQAPRPWTCSGKNTGVGCCTLLREVRGSSCLRDWTCVSWIGRWVLDHWCHLGSPEYLFTLTLYTSLSLYLANSCWPLWFCVLWFYVTFTWKISSDLSSLNYVLYPSMGFHRTSYDCYHLSIVL